MKFTKESVTYVIRNWSTKTYEEMGEHIGVSSATLHTWVSKMRENGIDLPRKTRNSSEYMVAMFQEYLEDNPDWRDMLNEGTAVRGIKKKK
jgi:transposase